MRWLLLLVVGLAACADRTRSVNEEFREAYALRRAERFDLALAKTEAALRRVERGSDPVSVWRLRLLKADILLGRREAAQSLSVLDGYGDLPSGSDLMEQRAEALLLRGQASYTLSRLPEADRFLSQAADAAREAGSATLSAQVELRRGTLLVLQTRFDEARSVLQRALEESARLQDGYLEATAINNMGFALFTESRYDEAIPWFERAEALATKLGALDSMARADGSLGVCYARLGDSENASLHYDRAQAAFARTGNRLEQQTYIGNAGNLLLDAGDFTGAIASYKRALAVARAVSPVWTGRWLNNLASASIELGNWDAAEKFNIEGAALKKAAGDKLYEQSSLINSARIAAGRTQYTEATRLFRAALNGEAGDPTVLLEAHAGLADLYIRTSQPKKADAEFRAATDSIDQRGASLMRDDYKLSFLSSLIRFNRQYVDFLVASNEPDRALEVAESSRSRVLAGRLSNGKNGSPQAETPLVVEDYRRIARRTGAVLLEYWLGKERSYLWVVTSDQVRFHALPPRSVIHPLVENWSAFIASGRDPLKVAEGTGRDLYTALLGPVATDAPVNNRFIIVPDEDLYPLNFETLPAAGAPSKFWIEQATVTIAPSLNYLASAGTDHPHYPLKLLLIGDPESSDPQYPKLEFASQELDSIAGAMPGSEATVLKGSIATPDSYTRASPGQFRFIHFSAHASANLVNPLDSAVILSGQSDRSRLRARQVMSIPLRAELVTVSSCRGAGGRTYAGEGLVGFAWAFLKAGAGNVIAGLWDVNDRSTMQLMSRLYSEIAAGSSIPDALRASKLALIHAGGAYAKPFYWAPFQIYTSGR